MIYHNESKKVEGAQKILSFLTPAHHPEWERDNIQVLFFFFPFFLKKTKHTKKKAGVGGARNWGQGPGRLSLSFSAPPVCSFFFFNPGKSKGGPLLTEDLSPFYIDRIRPVYILMIFFPSLYTRCFGPIYRRWQNFVSFTIGSWSAPMVKSQRPLLISLFFSVQ